MQAQVAKNPNNQNEYLSRLESSEIEKHNQDVFDRLKPGDLIEFKRGLYSHWGMFNCQVYTA
jgi:hypothetical protein